MIEKDVGIAHAAGSESLLIFNEVVSSEFEIDSINVAGRLADSA